MSTPSGTPENPFSDDRDREDADRAADATGGAGSLPSYNAYAASGPTGPANGYAAPMAGSAYPGPGARLGALLIDFVVVWILTGVIAVIFVDFSSITLAAQIGMQFISLVIWLAYRIGMEVMTGASLGKMAFGLKVVDASGATLSAQDSLMRNLWYVVSTVVGMIPFLGWLLNLGVCIAVGVTISNDQFNQSFSDKWGKAYVVRSR